MRTALFLLLLVFYGCKQNTPQHDFDRLAGRWLMETPRQSFLEQWEKKGALYSGFMSVIENGDTITAENIRILAEKEDYYYEATTAGQNDSAAVKFKLVSYQPNEWVFENLMHDYPQRIVYAFVGNDSLVASISAVTGPEKLVYFRFRRLN